MEGCFVIDLVIRVGDVTHYFNPQKYFEVYDFLKEQLGWSHREADEAASWAEVAYYKESYDTGYPDVEIYFVDEED